MQFRVETLQDAKSGRYYVEIYYPETEAAPYVTSTPVYTSHEEAEKDVVNLFKKAFASSP